MAAHSSTIRWSGTKSKGSRSGEYSDVNFTVSDLKYKYIFREVSVRLIEDHTLTSTAQALADSFARKHLDAFITVCIYSVQKYMKFGRFQLKLSNFESMS